MGIIRTGVIFRQSISWHYQKLHLQLNSWPSNWTSTFYEFQCFTVHFSIQ